MSEESKNMKGSYFISSISITSSIAEYGISSIFVLFLLDVLNFSIPLSSNIYAYYYGFAYLLPILIGYISDKYLNKSTALTMGFISMIISQILLGFAASFYHPSTITYDTPVFNTQTITYFTGLFFLALGTSFSTLSITHIINSVNNNEDSRIKGFSIYYPVLNIGVLIGSIITSLIVGDENFELYTVAFFVFAAILTIGLISFRLFKNKYLVDNDGNPMKDTSSSDSIRNVSNKILSHISNKSILEINSLNLRQRRKLFNNSLNPHEKDRMMVFLVFLVVIILYRVAYSQTGLSLVFFITDYVERDVSFYSIPVQAFYMLNPIFVLILSPIFIKINTKVKERGIDLGFVNRSTISILFMAFCFVILASAGYFIDTGAIDEINLIWIITFEFFIVVSEIYFAIAGYSMVGSLAPEKYYSMFFGLYTATRSIAMFISGIISSNFPIDVEVKFIHNVPVNGLMSYFLIFVVTSLAAAAFLIVFRKRLNAKLHLEELNKS